MASRKIPLRSRSERRRRAIRLRRISLGILSAVCLVLLVFSGPISRAASRRLTSLSRRFVIREIVVEGARNLPVDSVIVASELRVGTPLFAVNVNEVEARLLREPWIAKAQVIRGFPDQIRIRVSERAPLACLRQERMWVVMADSVIADVPSSVWKWDLPILTPPHSVMVAAGKRLRDPAALSLVGQLTRANEVSPQLWANCSELYFRGTEIFGVLNEPDVEIRLGQGAGDLGWSGLAQLLHDETQNSELGSPSLIDMRFPGKLVVIPRVPNKPEQPQG